MMKETGVIVGLHANTVDVATALKTSCSSCKAKKNCGTSVLADMWNDKQNVITVTHSDAITIQLGQKVELSVDEKGVLLSALLVYLLPIIIFFCSYAFAQWWLQGDAKLPWLVIGIAFMCAGSTLTLVRSYLRSNHCKLKPEIQITKIFPVEIPVQAIN